MAKTPKELWSAEKAHSPLVPTEIIENRILLIRGQKVMIDRELANLYGVETKYLIRQVKRNIKRFPPDFMFKLDKDETANLRCQFVTSSWGGRRYAPYVFTELGIAMLSSVLKSDRAISVNIQIMRVFTKLREILASHKDLKRKIEEMESRYDHQFKVVFDAIKELIELNRQPVLPEQPKKKYGFETGAYG